MTKKLIATLTVVTALFVATTANAQVSSLGFVTVDNTDGGAPLADFVTNDLLATFSGQYTGAQLIVELTDGSIYQDGVGATVPPNGGFLAGFPSLRYDTFLAQGSAIAGGTDGEPSPGGGAVDLGGAAGAVFTTAGINQAWNPPGGVTVSDKSDYLLARVSLSKAAAGTAKILASANGQRFVLDSIPVIGGVIGAIPEPTTMMLTVFGLIGVAGSRRRRS